MDIVNPMVFTQNLCFSPRALHEPTAVVMEISDT